MLYMKEVEEAKRAAEKALQDELYLKTFAKKGAAQGPGSKEGPEQKGKIACQRCSIRIRFRLQVQGTIEP